MQKRKAISLRCRIIPLALVALALFCSCVDTLSEKEIASEGGGMKNLTQRARVAL